MIDKRKLFEELSEHVNIDEIDDFVLYGESCVYLNLKTGELVVSGVESEHNPDQTLGYISILIESLSARLGIPAVSVIGALQTKLALDMEQEQEVAIDITFNDEDTRENMEPYVDGYPDEKSLADFETWFNENYLHGATGDESKGDGVDE